MDTKSLTTPWTTETQLSAVLKSRLAAIDQRHQNHRNSQIFGRLVFNHAGTNELTHLPIIPGLKNKNDSMDDYPNLLVTNDEKLDDDETGDVADGVDDCRLLDRTSKSEEDGASCYLCTHCGKGYDSEHDLDEHLGQVRNGVSCETSHQRRTITESSSRATEEGTEENDEFLDDDEDVFSDSMKMDISTVQQQLAQSAQSDSPDGDGHQQKRAYSCKFCSKLFDSNSALNVHYTHTHRDKPQYECDLCGRVYGVKRELATHRRLHDGQPTHRCRQCGKEFGTKQLLRKHELWHTGERSHVCPQCGKAFFQKGHLTQHMMIHAGGRPHACHLCQKTFIFKFDLNRHMKIHAERVGNAEECATGAETTGSTDLITKSVSFESTTAVESEMTKDQSNGATESAAAMDSLFPAVPSSVNSVIQQFHQSSGSHHHGDALGAGASSFGLLRAWTPSTASFLDPSAANGQDQQHRAALAAAFAQALCHAQQQASIFAGFSASSPPLSHLFYDQQLQQQRSSAEDSDGRSQEPIGGIGGGSEHDSTSGSSPGTVDDPRETVDSSMTESPPPPSTCDSCRDYRQRLDASQKRIQELERDLSLRQSDVDALNSKIQRVADVASRLLESCSDFDKLWMLHSKQVYSQIQTILNALD